LHEFGGAALHRKKIFLKHKRLYIAATWQFQQRNEYKSERQNWNERRRLRTVVSAKIAYLPFGETRRN
jgi:hypothetical protein